MKSSKLRPNRLLSAGVVLSVVLALMISQSTVPTGAAQSVGGFDGAIYDIIPDSGTGISSTTPGSTFFLKGTIVSHLTIFTSPCTPSGSPTGTWRAWGFIADNGRAVINQSLTFEPLNGSLEVQGTTGITLANEPAALADSDDPSGPINGPTEVLSVVGGAGTFRGALGEAQIRPYCSSATPAPFKYDRAFRLVLREAPRRRGNNNILR